MLPFHLLDPDAEVQIVDRRLPHWSQPGAICFITWRTNDSMPKAVVNEWLGDRARWLRAHDIAPDDPLWHAKLMQLDRKEVKAFLQTFWNRWHEALDCCHGECALRKPELASMVAQSLQCFDGQRYLLLDFVVMPNHVHLLATFPDEEAMLRQCESWKHYTATQINRCLRRTGRFWQQDGFDHLVRSEVQLDYLRRYIEGNPAKANLRPGEFIHFSKPLA